VHELLMLRFLFFYSGTFGQHCVVDSSEFYYLLTNLC